MGDVLIKNLELPRDCRYCPCVRFDKDFNIVRCYAIRDNFNDEDVIARDYDEWDMLNTTRSKPLEKPSWCPIVELPKHGDLIERQKVLSYFETVFLMGADMDYEDVVAIVSNPKAIPTIMEATE